MSGRSSAVLLLLCLVVHVPTVTTEGGNSSFKRVCYYTGWAQYRPSPYKFFPENLDPHLCTHVIYSFYLFNWDSWTLKPDEWNAETMLGRLTDLRVKNPSLKVMIAVGGFTFGSSPFSAMCSTAGNRQAFVKSAVSTLKKNKLDGLDIDWEYPTLRGGVAKDKENLVMLLKELRQAFKQEGYLLSIAAPAGHTNIYPGYDPQIALYVDFINLMTYDYHGSWESVTGYNSPMNARKDTDPKFSVNATVSIYMNELKIPAEKLVLGMPVYGRTWTLTTSETGPGSPGVAGPYTKYMRQAGLTSYYEICLRGPLKPTWDSRTKVPYLIVDNNVWISYDNIDSLKVKTDLVLDLGLGGAMFWALDLDDFSGSCGAGNFTLIESVKKMLVKASSMTATTTTTIPTATGSTPSSTTSSTSTTTTSTSASTTISTSTKSTPTTKFTIKTSTITNIPTTTRKSTTTAVTNPSTSLSSTTVTPSTSTATATISTPTTTTPKGSTIKVTYEIHTTTSGQSSINCLYYTDIHYRKDAGYYANPSNCRQFRYCFGMFWDFLCLPYWTCAPRTAWDPTKLTCDHDYRVSCPCAIRVW